MGWLSVTAEWMQYQDLIDNLTHQVPLLLQEENVPGLSVTVLHDAEQDWNGCFGVADVRSGAPVTELTVFEAASLSKPVFAYGALKLCESGVLDLDARLQNYLPEPYIRGEPRITEVTTRQVLSHSAGFPNWRPKGGALKMYFHPGERFSYSGEGFMYLQAVVDGLIPIGILQWYDANLFDPLGMHHSYFTWDGLESGPVAIGHDEAGKPHEKQSWDEMYGPASLHSTAQDYAKFIHAVLRPEPGNPAHLSQAMTDEMLRPQVWVNNSYPWDDDWPKQEIELNERVAWGLGWGIQNEESGQSFWHWGDNGNYQAFTIGSPDKDRAIVILTNGKNGRKVIERILREIAGGDYPSLDWLKG